MAIKGLIVEHNYSYLILGDYVKPGYTGKAFFETRKCIVDIYARAKSDQYRVLFGTSRELGIPIKICEDFINTNKGKIEIEFSLNREISLKGR